MYRSGIEIILPAIRLFTQNRYLLYGIRKDTIMTDADERLLRDIGMFTDENELTLLAHWSIDKHREDIADIDSSLFIRKKLYSGVLEGKNPMELMKDGQIEDSSITELMSIATSDNNREEYAEARTRALLKQRANYAQKIASCNKEETTELIEKIKRTEAVISGNDFKPLATNYGANFLKELEETQSESNPQYGHGFRFLDKYTEGLHRGELTVIGARPRIGKSAIALQIAYNVAAEQGYKVLFLPLEMTVNACLHRILLQSQAVEPEYKKDCTAADKERISNFLDSLEENLKFCAALNRLEDIERIIKAEKPYLVVIDQLSQVKIAGKKKDIREQYVEITRALKRIAIEQNVAIIALSQLNRTNADRERPGLEALSESDSIGQDADNVITLYTKNDEEDTDAIERDTFLYLVKQRNGISGIEIPLKYRGCRFTFSAVDTTRRTAAQARQYSPF